MENKIDVVALAREAGGILIRPYDYGAEPDRLIMMFTSLERFAALVAEAERNSCIADCMEQHKLSIEAAEKAKKVRDQDTYFNTATGAKFAAIRIQQRGNVK